MVVLVPRGRDRSEIPPLVSSEQSRGFHPVFWLWWLVLCKRVVTKWELVSLTPLSHTTLCCTVCSCEFYLCTTNLFVLPFWYMSSEVSYVAPSQLLGYIWICLMSNTLNILIGNFGLGLGSFQPTSRTLGHSLHGDLSEQEEGHNRHPGRQPESRGRHKEEAVFPVVISHNLQSQITG